MVRAAPLALGALAFWVADVATPRPAAAPAPAPAPARFAPHPRLLLSPEVLARLRAKAAARDPDWLAVAGQADRLLGWKVADYDRNATPPDTIAYAYQGFGWYE